MSRISKQVPITNLYVIISNLPYKCKMKKASWPWLTFCLKFLASQTRHVMVEYDCYEYFERIASSAC